MNYRKTPESKRGTYSYRYYGIDGKLIEEVVLRPGENGVTSADIKRLHSMDDAEVYNNLKNSRPPVQKWQKAAIAEWKSRHPYEDLPMQWNVSICETAGETNNMERESLIADIRTIEEPETEAIDRLHEVISTLTLLQQNTYRKIIIEGKSNVCVASEEHKSEAAVRKIINRIKDLIANDELLKLLSE